MNRPTVALSLALGACAALAAPVPRPKEGVFAQPGWARPFDSEECRITKAGGTLIIEVPKKDHDLDGRRGRANAPSLVREVEGDFRMEVRVRGNFHATERSTARGVSAHSSAGLLALPGGPNGTSVRVELGAGRSRDEELAYVAMKQLNTKNAGGALTTTFEHQRSWPLSAGARECYLRLDRAGAWFHAYTSPDGVKWTKFSAQWAARPAARLKVGVIACSTSSAPLKVTFDQFKLTRAANARPVNKQ